MAGSPPRRSWVLASVLLSAVVVASCAGAHAPTASKLGPPAPKGSAGGSVSSNVWFSDYAGSRTCEPCHSSVVEAWSRSPMHNMTRDESRDLAVQAPFDASTFHFKGDTAILSTVGGARFFTISSKRFGDGVYRVTRVIGGHHREDFVGARVARADPSAPFSESPPEELVMPVSWLIGPRVFRYKGYSVMVKERGGLRPGPVWNQTCIFCHNTVPYASTVLGALAHGPATYQGVVVDAMLPLERRATYAVKDTSSFASALVEEEKRLGAPNPEPELLSAISVTRARFRREHLVEAGIGCESCHLGAREHVADSAKLPSFEPKSASFEVRLPKDTGSERAARINRVCARCHQVLFSGYEPTWEGGSRRGKPGGSHINSGEARDMLLGACASKLSCIDCHDPHDPEGARHISSRSAAEEARTCARCHDRFGSRSALEQHTHHNPEGEGSRCLSCHMPRKNMSLDGDLSRYHRIGSPTDSARVLLDRPLECALCHADKTVDSLVSTMERWYGHVYDREALRKLYGALDVNVMRATATVGKPHEQAVAFFVLGQKRDAAAIPTLAKNLTHPYPLVRGYAKRALDAISGAPVPIDIDDEDAAIEAATDAWLSRNR